MLELVLFGRSDDGRDALLRHPSGQVVRYPDPDGELDDIGHVLIDIRPGTTFTARRAGSYVLLHSSEIELILPFLELMPAIPARCDLILTPLPSELDEGVTNGNDSSYQPR